MVDLHVVSVHYNIPALTILQVATLREQKGINFHFSLVDNYEKPHARLSKFYEKLRQDGLVDSIYPLKAGSHSIALNRFFNKPERLESERILIIDSDCFPTSPDSFKTVCKEIDERGVTGIFRRAGRLWGDPFDICFFGVTKEKILKAHLEVKRKFRCFGFMPENYKTKYKPPNLYDTGDAMCWHCMGEKPMPETEAAFEHIKAVTITYHFDKPMKTQRANDLHRLATEYHAYDLFEKYGLILPKNNEGWIPSQAANPPMFDEVFEALFDEI